MSTRRSSIVSALTKTLNDKLNGTAPYNFNIYKKAEAKLKFWDEVVEFPALFLTPGTELRDYLPGGFTWGYLNVSIKLYVKSADKAPEELEKLLNVVESVVDDNRTIVYDIQNNYETTEILIQSITTDEGLLDPYGVGEMNLLIRYQIM